MPAVAGGKETPPATKFCPITARFEFTVTENVPCAVLLAESVTVTTIESVSFVVGAASIHPGVVSNHVVAPVLELIAQL